MADDTGRNHEEKNPKPLETQKVKAEVNDDNLNTSEKKSSLDILWRQAFREIDEWAKIADFRDEVFLKQAICFAEGIRRNQGNISLIAEQFSKEIAEWERAAREELLMSTTTLQHFLPKISYEEMNQQIDQFQNKALSILKKPYQVVENIQVIDRYMEIVEQFIELRRKSRKQFTKTIKQAGNLVYESQKGFAEILSSQIKALVLPFNKYMEKEEELTKS